MVAVKLDRRCHDECIRVGDRMLRLHAGGRKDAFSRDVDQPDRQTGDVFRDSLRLSLPSFAGDNIIDFAETDVTRQEGRGQRRPQPPSEYSGLSRPQVPAWK